MCLCVCVCVCVCFAFEWRLKSRYCVREVWGTRIVLTHLPHTSPNTLCVWVHACLCARLYTCMCVFHTHNQSSENKKDRDWWKNELWFLNIPSECRTDRQTECVLAISSLPVLANRGEEFSTQANPPDHSPLLPKSAPHIHPVITAHPFIESPLCLSNSSVHSWMDRSFHSL